MTTARQQATKLGERFMEIRYEDLQSAPFGAYRRLFDFCCIPYDQTLLDQVFEETDFEKNYEPGEGRFHRGGRVGDWRRELSFADALRFDRAAGDLLVAAGYARSRFWWLPWEK